MPAPIRCSRSGCSGPGSSGGANAVTFIVYGALGGALFLLPVELQVVVGYSPLESGLALLPVTAIMLVFSARSGHLAARIGPRLQMTVGPVVVGAGLLLLTRATHNGSYVVWVLPAVLVFGAGLAITVAPLTATALGAVPAEHAGVASAVNNVVARAAGLLAVATLPLVAGITGAAALEPDLLAAGFRHAMIIAGITCAAGGVLAAVTIRNPADRSRLRLPHLRWYHCALDAPPLRPSETSSTARLTGRSTDRLVAGPRRGREARPLPCHESAVEVGDRGAAHTDQAGRGKAGGVPLLADDHHRSIGILGLGEAVRASGVEAPFEVVALDDQRAGNLTELGPLGRRPDVDQ